MAYSHKDIKQAYKQAGVTKGRVVLVKTDLRWLGPYEDSLGPDMLAAHFQALTDLVDLGLGTIVVSTSSTGLCNTDTPYDPANTPSERGVFTEYIRKLQGAVRSHHAFMSHAAIGAQAEYICGNVSRHAYGLETPKARMLELDAMYLSVGLEPRLTCSFVHHVEMLMGVPYRYTKEFIHPVVQPDGSIEKEPFYIYVCYRGLDLKRNRNVKLFNRYAQSGYPMATVSLGQGTIWGYDCRDFCTTAASHLRQDIYGWLDHPPAKKPFRS